MTSTAPKLRLRASPSATGENPLARLSWQPRRADTVWTRAEWTALVEHLHNGNEPFRFVMGWHGPDRKTQIPSKQYARSKKLAVNRAISWSWTSIAMPDKARKLAFVPYSTNDRQQSRWGGLDFDAHQEGQADRARELAFAAFRVLLNAPDLCIVLETSGSVGWHVWAISPDFHDTQEWVRLLKSVANTIGAPIEEGVCEIFPPDTTSTGLGKGMRAPGCWNPNTDQCSGIVWENTRSYLETVLSGNSKTAPLNCNGLQHELPDRERSFLSSSPSPLSYRESELLQKLGISASNTRNGKLCSLVGEVFHQTGHAVARRLAELQYRTAAVKPVATEGKHLESFETLWAGLAHKWSATLSPAERAIMAGLETENERDAFRIVRSFGRKAQMDGSADFPIVRSSLATRLGITEAGTKKIRDKLVAVGATVMTAPYVPNKFAARFKWLSPITT